MRISIIAEQCTALRMKAVRIKSPEDLNELRLAPSCAGRFDRAPGRYNKALSVATD
jgi:hypothetical protein